MSLTDRNLSILACHPLLMTGGVTLAGGQNAVEDDEEATLSEEGWDSLRKSYVMARANLTAENLAAMFPQGAQLASRKWWITGARPVRLAPGLWRADVDFKGWAATKAAKIRVGSSAEQQSGENVRAPAYVGDTVGTVYAKVQTHENAPTIAATYLVEDITASGVAKTDKVGTAQTPPVTVAVPDSVWGFLTEFVWHWPQGWVLMSSEQDRLPGTNAALVTDSYKFIRDKTPG